MNAHEDRARMMKALQLTSVLKSAGVEAGQEISEESWELAVKLARVNPPSEATKVMVLAMLRVSEGAVPGDPFANISG